MPQSARPTIYMCPFRDFQRSCFIMYEFWLGRFSWMSYLQCPIGKTFQCGIIYILEDPEMVSTMLPPASWWIMNNN
ncbi:N-terminal EF-hand calcium-binding protein 1-like [Salvelinus namaycush]|uniref:N-terminal EF-hand calcium-binding protein 1-like n=1 Tax=Salvelinus namaycush TaxID=8040 RepID=A0A8U1EY45_SALNM|nr:N-terminal EF-hand calcium-binding protein 1-like [Salvelinus namaycush]